MKKNQVKAAKITMLGYSAAMAIAGSTISLDASAACTDGTAAAPVHCEWASGSVFQEDWSITGSVAVAVAAGTNGDAICSWNLSGKKSFGLTLNGGSMYIRDATGKATDAASGCAQ